MMMHQMQQAKEKNKHYNQYCTKMCVQQMKHQIINATKEKNKYNKLSYTKRIRKKLSMMVPHTTDQSQLPLLN